MISFAFISSFIFIILATLPVPNSTVILLPDEDGKVGVVSVTNKVGTQTLNEAYTSVEVMDENSDLITKKVDKEQIQERYQSTLFSQPDKVSNYILYFISGSDELTEASKLGIPRVIADISARKTYEAYIVGHTDTVGPKDDNYQLGLKRATVLKEIVEKQLSTNDKIQLRSNGEGDLLVATQDNIDEPKNRRVEIEIH